MVIPKMIDVDGGVLVAHDGSRDAAGALRMAVRIAAALEVPVTVAHMWTLRTASRPDSATFGYMPRSKSSSLRLWLNWIVTSLRSDVTIQSW